MSQTIKSKCSCNSKEFYPAKVRATVNGYERIISFQSGYICERPSNEGSYHGRHGMNLIFILKGELGAIQFVIYTGWMPNWGISSEDNTHLMPADIGRHSYKPKYEDDLKREGCPWLDGKDCYYDGSSLQADEVFKKFVSKGEEAMWAEMEEYYKAWLVNPAVG